MSQFFGKYEGTVDQNFDPLGKGRLLVKVPAIFRDASVWALPCVPYAGPDVGFFMMPPTDAYVWVEFAGGDPNRAIWSGCFWGGNDSPPVSMSPIAAKKKMLKTDTCTLTLDDTPGAGGVTIETSAGQKIKLSTTGIEIDNGTGATVKLTGPSVKLNDLALEVT
jgi:uncharacterized protein involved in type VI secretion and phage assembly